MPLFQKSLTDLVRGIRSHKKDEQEYINEQIQQCKKELKQPDIVYKVIAIQKLTYLQMMGYDMSFAAFNVIDVMSSSKFSHKRVGYLAANQSYQETTDVVIMATNLLKKDFSSSNQYEAGIAINCLANICTPDLAQDLAQDVVSMLNSSKPYIRKRAVLCLYKIFLQFPDALRPAFPRLKSKLEDSDVSVISAAVNVICELARKNPRNYLGLAPIFFKLLTVSNNNWMLIKIVKLMGALTPHEPRLAKKLIGPLTNIINTTPAMSLLYECINTCTIGLNQHIPIIRLCVTKLRAFVEDPDQNLKYLGLLALGNIMKYHPRAVSEHRDLVLSCLEDEDVTIRKRALDLVGGMVSKKNLTDIVRRLVGYIHTADGSYRENLIEKVITICSQNTYEAVRDFEWYISVLVELTRVRGTKHGRLIADEFLNVAIRVQVIRPYAVANMVNLILDPRFLSDTSGSTDTISEVLYAAAWIVGEFAAVLEADHFVRLIDAMLQPKVGALPARIQGVYLQNSVKLLAEAVSRMGIAGLAEGVQPAPATGSLLETPLDSAPSAGTGVAAGGQQVASMMQTLLTRLPSFAQSVHVDVQERACCFIEVLDVVQALVVANPSAGAQLTAELKALFKGKMNPVAPAAQRKVPVPEGLDLDAWINTPPDEDLWERLYGQDHVDTYADDGSNSWKFGASDGGFSSPAHDYDAGYQQGGSPEAGASRYQNIYHLGPARTHAADPRVNGIDVSQIPMETLVLDGDSLQTQAPVIGRSGRRRKRRGNRGGAAAAQAKPIPEYVIDTTVDVPEGFHETDDDDDDDKDDIAKALDIDISAPLGADEVLPQRTHYQPSSQPAAPAAAAAAPAPAQPAIGRSGRRRKRRGQSSNAAAAAAAAAPAPTSSQGGASLLDLGGGGGGGAAAAAAPVVLTTSEMPPQAAASAAAPAAGGKRRRRKRRNAQQQSAVTTASSAGAAGAAVAAAGTAAGGIPSPRPALKLLCQDDALFVNYMANPTMNTPHQLTVAVNCANNSSGVISSIEFTIVDSMNMRVVKTRPDDVSVKTDLTLFAGVNNIVPLVFTFDDFDQPQSLRGSLSYILTPEGGAPTQRNLDFRLEFPVSSFVVAVPLPPAEFAGVCGTPGMAVGSAKFSTQMSFAEAVSTIMGMLHLAIIDAAPTAVSLYGCSIRSHHVAALVKQQQQGGVSIDFKGSDADLIQNLVQEVQEFFASGLV